MQASPDSPDHAPLRAPSKHDDNDDVFRDGYVAYMKKSLHFLFYNKLSLLIIFVPIGMALGASGTYKGLWFMVFVLPRLSLI